MTWVVSACLVLVALLTMTPAVAAPSTAMREHVVLKLVEKRGTHFRHRGTATGTIGGRVTSEITLDSLSLTGSVTVVARAGTMRLRVSGTARSGGLRSRFSGTAKVVGGTGRYVHAKGRGTFQGVVNRSSWAATIDAHGGLTV